METFFSPSQQTMFFLYSILMGVCLGVVFDFFRAMRIILVHTSFFVALEDILFLFIWAVSLLVFSMELSRGEVRFYYFLGNILGFTLYYFTVGKVVVGVIKFFVGIIYKILGFFYSIFVKPITHFLLSVCQISLHVFVIIYSKFKLFLNHLKISLKDKHRLLYNRSTRNKNKKEVAKVEKSSTKKSKKRRSSAQHI